MREIEVDLDENVKINGTVYSGYMFQELSCSFPNLIGQVLRVDKKEGGLVTVTRLPEREIDDKYYAVVDVADGFFNGHENVEAALSELETRRGDSDDPTTIMLVLVLDK